MDARDKGWLLKMKIGLAPVHVLAIYDSPLIRYKDDGEKLTCLGW